MIYFNHMDLNLCFERPLSILGERYGFCLDCSGRKIEAIQTDEKLIKIEARQNNILIYYHRTCDFLRAVLEVVQREIAGELCFQLVEEVFFDYNGLMLDCSRNGVVSINYAKELIEMMAAMGHSVFMLYMEDTYELDGVPYFGYLRGRYSKAELVELDDYADLFGIELVPCIQTLAHLNQFFAWDEMKSKYVDIDDILQVGKTEVKELLERMFQHISETFRTKRIHIGMDEAYHLGRGNYANEHGLRQKTDIMMDHLDFIGSLAETYGLRTIIWDDMFFSAYSNMGAKEYHIPEHVDLMYWDYYNNTEAHYAEQLRMREKISDKVMFAGGAWKWTGFTPHHSKTFAATNAALAACKKAGIREVVATSWADDGAECPISACLYGLVLFAEHSHHRLVSMEHFKYKLDFYTGMNYDVFMKQEAFDILPDFSNKAVTVTPSKYLLYEDPLLSMFVHHAKHIKGDISAHYAALAHYFTAEAEKQCQPVWKASAEFYAAYAEVMELKWNLGSGIYDAYHEKDKLGLRDILENKMLPLMERYENMRHCRMKEWMLTNKSFGFEILDLRFGGMKQRLKTAAEIIRDYINGAIPYILELEEVRLPATHFREEGMGEIIHFNSAYKSMSPSRTIW